VAVHPTSEHAKSSKCAHQQAKVVVVDGRQKFGLFVRANMRFFIDSVY